MELENGYLVLIAIVGAIAVLIAILFVVARRSARTRQEAWERFAIERGLHYHAPVKMGDDLRVDGLLNGRTFALYEHTVSSGSADSSTRSITHMELTPRGAPEGLTAHERATGRLGKAMESLAFGVVERLGARVPDEVATGDPAIDEKWVVRGFDADAVRAWTSSGTRLAALLEVCAEEDFGVAEGAICWKGNSLSKREKVEAISLRLEHYADRFEAS